MSKDSEGIEPFEQDFYSKAEVQTNLGSVEHENDTAGFDLFPGKADDKGLGANWSKV